MNDSVVSSRQTRHSAIYSGRVRHRRFTPTRHSFVYRIFMMYLDLDELPDLFAHSWLWSFGRKNIACFRREDYFGDKRLPLKQAVLNEVERQTGKRPAGPVRMLTNLRYFGFIINPISCYYCFAEDGESLEYIVADVTNTPWGESYAYVLPCQSGQRLQALEFSKSHHVSPFHPMDMNYRWRCNVPQQSLSIHLENWNAHEKAFDATLGLKRSDLSAKTLRTFLVSYPMLTLKICLAIYWQALRLFLKKTPFYSHPKLQPNAGK